MALTHDREIPVKGTWFSNYLKVAANQIIYIGSFVNVNSNGYVVSASDSVNQQFIGISRQNINTIGLSDGAKTIMIGYIQQVELYDPAINLSDIGKAVYTFDDENISLTSVNVKPCGYIIALDEQRHIVTIQIDIGLFIDRYDDLYVLYNYLLDHRYTYHFMLGGY